MNFGAIAASLFLYALGTFVLYVVIRIAVRHAIQDAWRERGERDEPRQGGA